MSQTTIHKTRKARMVFPMLAIVGVFVGVLSPMSASAQDTGPAKPAAPSVEAATIVEGETVKVGWPDGSLTSDSVAIVSAPEGSEDDESSWDRVDRQSIWSQDGVVMNLAELRLGVPSVFAYSDVAANGGLMNLSEWSDSFTVGSLPEVEPITVDVGGRASKGAPAIKADSGADVWCNGTPGAFPCGTWTWPNGKTTSANYGLLDGCDVLPRTLGSIDMCGAYTRGVPHMGSTSGPARAAYSPRNPYGFGYCMDDGAAASNSTNPVPYRVDPYFRTSFGSTGKPRVLLANYILTHYGNPSIWNIPSTQATIFSNGAGSPGVSSFEDDVMSVSGTSYTLKERIAAVNVAVKIMLNGGRGGVGEGPAELTSGAGAGDVKVRDLANWMRQQALTYAQDTGGSIRAEVVSRTGNDIRVRVTNRRTGARLRSVAVKPIEGSLVNVNALVTTGTAASSGAGGTQKAGDSYNYNNQLLAGGYTNSNGEVIFRITPGSGTNPWQARFHAEAPRTDITMWAGVSGSQANVMSTGTIATTFDVEGIPPVVNAEVFIRKSTTNPDYQSGEGAVFQVRSGSAAGPVVATLTVGANGNSNGASLLPGTYHITETVAPPGQTITYVPETVTLEDGERFTIRAINSVLESGEIELIKLDDSTDAPLAGAVFGVTYDSDDDGTYETDIGSFVSQSTPVVVDGLMVGKYRIEELSPPPGYTLPEIGTRVQFVELTYGSPTTPDDDVLSGTVTVRDVQPTIATQVVDGLDGEDINLLSPTIDEDFVPTDDGDPETADPTHSYVIPAISDEIVVGNIAEDVTGEVVTGLYGPQVSGNLGEFQCVSGNLVAETRTATTGSGTYRSAEVTPPGPGVYAFVSTWTGSDGSTVTHPCGVASETVSVPGISTEATQQSTTYGSPITDTATLVGLTDGTAGEITFAAYGPFAASSEIVCSPETEVWSDTVLTDGSGEFASPEFTPETAGIFTYVATWNGTDGGTVAHPCGLVSETVVQNPTIVTEVNNQNVEVGSSVQDISTLSGVPDGMTGTSTFELYGPFATVEDINCSPESLYATVTADTVGSGVTTSPEVKISEAGLFTFVEIWESTSTEITTTHACGLPPETTTVSEPGVPPTTVPPTTVPAPPTTGGGGGGDDFKGGGGGGDGLAVTGSETAGLVGVALVLLLSGVGILLARKAAGRRDISAEDVQVEGPAE